MQEMPIVVAFLLAIVAGNGAALVSQKPEATSLLGKPLVSPDPAPDVKARMEADLAAARAALKKTPNDPDALIWVGRRTAYLGRHREAIDIFSDGVKRFPSDARFLRHRGHRYITVREFDRAIADLEKAAALVAGKPPGSARTSSRPSATSTAGSASSGPRAGSRTRPRAA